MFKWQSWKAQLTDFNVAGFVPVGKFFRQLAWINLPALTCSRLVSPTEVLTPNKTPKRSGQGKQM